MQGGEKSWISTSTFGLAWIGSNSQTGDTRACTAAHAISVPHLAACIDKISFWDVLSEITARISLSNFRSRICCLANRDHPLVSPNSDFCTVNNICLIPSRESSTGHIGWLITPEEHNNPNFPSQKPSQSRVIQLVLPSNIPQ